jgi:hypothetical protein
MQYPLDIPGSPLGGGDLVASLENILKSLASSRKGNSRPSDVQPGEIWIDDNNNPAWLVKLFDGDADIVLFSVAANSDQAVVPVGSGGTGATTAAAARSNLGLVYDDDILTPTGSAANLQDLPADVASIITTRGDLIVGDADGKPARLPKGAAGQVPSWNASGDAVVRDLPPSQGDYLTWTLTEYTTPGSYTFTAPDGVTQVVVECCGGGGGSGGVSLAGAGGPGGCGGYIRALVPVSGGSAVPVTVGAGGAGGAKSTTGYAGSGGSSSFGSFLTATGGSGGKNTSETKGAQGTATYSESVLLLLKSYTLADDNNGPISRVLAIADNLVGAVYGGGASKRTSTTNDGRTGLSGASGLVRVWAMEG